MIACFCGWGLGFGLLLLGLLCWDLVVVFLQLMVLVDWFVMLHFSVWWLLGFRLLLIVL